MIGRVTRAAIFYGASSMLGCGSEPTPANEAPAEEPASEAATSEPTPEPSRTPEAPFPTPDIAPDTDEEARAERAHAEGGKRRETTVREHPDYPDIAPVPLYGGPPADFVV